MESIHLRKLLSSSLDWESRVNLNAALPVHLRISTRFPKHACDIHEIVTRVHILKQNILTFDNQFGITNRAKQAFKLFSLFADVRVRIVLMSSRSFLKVIQEKLMSYAVKSKLIDLGIEEEVAATLSRLCRDVLVHTLYIKNNPELELRHKTIIQIV
jgi:hypothetical protein